MKFGGLKKTSLIDFPNRISSVLFTLGCNLRCPFCHNWRLIIDPKPPFLSEVDALKILRSRKRFVDAIVITGGEPTMNIELPIFVKKLKDEGFAIKLDTNGFLPEVLKSCLPYIDYVALDIKTSPEKYNLLGAKDTKSLLKSIQLLIEGNIDYEFRNTVVPGFVDKDDIHEIGKIVDGAKRFIFQKFIPEDTLDKSLKDVKPYSTETIISFAETIKNYVDNVSLKV
jgi:pyruvate formate lyase activating enzyme